MNILNKLTIKHLKQNKKRTVVTIPKFFTNLLNLMTLSINSISLYDSHFSFFTF
mgnify:CR=1 FL=1